MALLDNIEKTDLGLLGLLVGGGMMGVPRGATTGQALGQGVTAGVGGLLQMKQAKLAEAKAQQDAMYKAALMQQMEREAKKPIMAGPGTQLRDPNDPTKVLGQVPFKPTNPPALEAKIQEIMASQGVDRKTASAIATGVVGVGTDPVSGQRFMYDKVSQTTKPLSSGGGNIPVAQFEDQKPKTLWELSEDTAGLSSAAREVRARVGGQAKDLLGAVGITAPEGIAPTPKDLTVTQARQSMTAAQNDLIRALSLNPRYPVGEINRLKDEVGIGPKAFDSPDALRSRMRGIDGFLSTRYQNEIAVANDPNAPAQMRKDAYQAANAIQRFRSQLGVPKGDEPKKSTPKSDNAPKRRKYNSATGELE